MNERTGWALIAVGLMLFLAAYFGCVLLGYAVGSALLSSAGR